MSTYHFKSPTKPGISIFVNFKSKDNRPNPTFSIKASYRKDNEYVEKKTFFLDELAALRDLIDRTIISVEQKLYPPKELQPKKSEPTEEPTPVQYDDDEIPF